MDEWFFLGIVEMSFEEFELGFIVLACMGEAETVKSPTIEVFIVLLAGHVLVEDSFGFVVLPVN